MPRTSASFSPNSALRMAPGQAAAGASSLPTLATLTAPFDQHGHGAAAPTLQGLGGLIDTLDRYLRLPSTPRGFMLYLAGLMLVFTGALLHVLVAAQIMAAEIGLRDHEREYELIEQQNSDLIFEISLHQNVMELQARARQLGYAPADTHEYVFVQDGAPLTTASSVPLRPLAPAVDVSATAPVSPPGEQAPWRAWSDFLRSPALTEWTQADAPAPTRPDLLTEFGKQLERLGIR